MLGTQLPESVVHCLPPLEAVQINHLGVDLQQVLNDVRYEDGGVVRGDDVLVA